MTQNAQTKFLNSKILKILSYTINVIPKYYVKQ